MQCAHAILLSVACPPVQYFSTSSRKRFDFRKKVTESEVCFQFIYSFETFINLRRNARDMIKKKCILVFM
jgi:hypothetical protein